MRISKGFIAAIFIMIVYMGCAGGIPLHSEAAKKAPGAISYEVDPSAKITKVIYYLGNFKGRKTVFFEIGLKNISDSPKRFKVTVDIPQGPSSAYFYPRKGKPPILKAGQEYMKPIPMVFFDELPSAFSIIVKEMR